MALLEVNDLRTSFFTAAGEVKAVNGVSFSLDRHKVLGIVGESGSGKSVTAYSIMQILDPNGRIVGGLVLTINEKTQHNHLDLLFVDPAAHSKGLGQAERHDHEALRVRLQPVRLWQSENSYCILL